MTDDTDSGHATVDEARPMVLLRYLPGITGEATRTVHFVPLPSPVQARDAGIALCGVVLRPELVEQVTPGQGMPCAPCVINHLTTNHHHRPRCPWVRASAAKPTRWWPRSATERGAGQSRCAATNYGSPRDPAPSR